MDRWPRVDVPLLMVPLFMVPLLIVPVPIEPVVDWVGLVMLPDVVPLVVVPLPDCMVPLGVLEGVVWAKAALVQRVKAAARKMLKGFMKKGNMVNRLVV